MPVNLSVFENFNTIEGIKIGFTNAGVKQTKRPDIVVFELDETASTAGIFTENAFCAAPVQISKKHLKEANTRYLIINTGNANAGTGKGGYEDALEICNAVAKAKGVSVEQVLPFSTGVIGERLPMGKILPAIPYALENTRGDVWFDASRGIMTTDTQPKGTSSQFEFEGQTISISGISKGAGMIKPNMATMLGFIATDAPVEKELLQELCSELGNKSFNRISIDGDTSTNDSCMLMASGTANVEKLTSKDQPLYQILKDELEKVFLYLAHAIVRDGEGATKFVAINVQNCENSKEALRIAYTIAHSPLVKTALYASDANWGRILAAVGRSGVRDMDVEKINLYLDDVCIAENGARAPSYTEAAGSAVMAQSELTIRVDMGRGDACETVWTTDLSHDYVTINADYRS
ncbi:bifunctional glutamate N-acetyltransferase/amino-acid acetyltransferase ArgJ [Bermanella sp. WJH001]|uniref:bifunctional glutamate N-acetyltransferase/amino-acid acetyltransferase ArgJ n=1 Tax=Bermanella sp. WJH001 TaxID=3048005 RepID=UPI0024BE8DA0|nr:bifunctional glutamate N-acetyltransferase/amino-acid acetyltransferase ArgJ [Bermanella sp. WJH001]MDJ1537894.1 bifunctional glutamate N-acetyltransferase/amino-acid acetyltransferase ArgJ [Bermanella sp. WJH001]